MSTLIRPEITKQSEYYIPKHRFYELKHFCMQYPTWDKSSNKVKMIQHCIADTDEIIGPMIFQAIINDWSYEITRARLNVPCCKDTYYHLYRKFFYILSNRRE